MHVQSPTIVGCLKDMDCVGKLFTRFRQTRAPFELGHRLLAKGRCVLRGWPCLAILLCCWSCAGKLQDRERFEFLLDASLKIVPAPDCATTLFKSKCSESICHGPGAPQVDLVSDGVAERLIGQPSSDTGMCKGKTLISTSEASSSLLLQKIGDSPPCGSKMPLGGASLTSAESMCLQDWVGVVDGAHKDGGS
jgi:hypothetical protein